MAKATARKFKCPKCGRTFSMAAHLARHQNTMHAAKGKKKTVKKKRGRRAARKAPRRIGPRAKRGPRVAASGTTPLLRQMHVYRGGLVAQQTRLASQIDAIDRALAALGAAPAKPAAPSARGRRGPRARRGSLKDYIGRVLRAGGAPMTVKDVTASVRRAGFKSRNKTLAKSVGIAMSQMPDVAKVSRGVFRLK
jgi:uncharacterized C2H2 Zn-finger protein